VWIDEYLQEGEGSIATEIFALEIQIKGSGQRYRKEDSLEVREE